MNRDAGKAEIPEKALRAKTDMDFRNRFLSESTNFILKRAYGAVGHFVTESDDEWSIALMAFNEAIDRYDTDKGTFEAYATLLIRSRLYDYLRKERKFAQEIAVEMDSVDAVDDGDGSTGLVQEVQKKTSQQAMESETGSAGEEIEAVGQLLGRYGISVMELASASPKSMKTKKSCAEVIALVLRDEKLYTRLRSTKMIPAADIRKSLKVSPKLLERHRRYIIAAVEILHGDFPILGEYFGYVRELLK